MILKGILKSFNSATYKATVQIVGSLNVWLSDVPTSHALSSADMVAGRYVAVLTPDPGKPGDSVLVALWSPATPPDAISLDNIVDADGDTMIQVEESADEDMIRMDVAGVEAFLLSDVGILTLAKQSSVKVYRSAYQLMVKNTYDQVEFDMESWDIQNEYDSTTNYRFTATEAGKYFVSMAVLFISLADGAYVGAVLKKNGAYTGGLYNWFTWGSANNGSVFVLGDIDLAANDYIDFWVYHDSAVDKNISGIYDYRCFATIRKAV